VLHYAAACGLGLLAGGAFAWIWLRVVPAGTNRRFWSAMSGLTREMLQVEETGAFLRLYRRLGGLLAKYVARNLGGAALGCLPMIAILLTVAPLVFSAWDARAPRLALIPAEAANLVTTPAALSERTGYCATDGYCALFAALDFKVVRLEPAPTFNYVVARADHGDANPLWPFLSDIEAAFFAAFILATLMGLLWPHQRRS
jgi:hypothetical protein